MSAQAIVFDLDGTLVDSAPSILDALSQTLKNQGIEPKVTLVPSLIGPPLQEILRKVTGFQAHDKRLSDLIDQFKLTYDGSYCWQAGPYPGIDLMLSQISVDHRLTIATNKRKGPTEKILEHLSWSKYFDEVVCIDKGVTPFKCKADILESLIQKMRIKRDLLFYIGDRGEDLEAARACGVAFGLAGWGYMDSADNAISGDDYYRLSAPNEVLKLL